MIHAETITSLQNPLVKEWRALNKSRAQRLAQGLFMAEGEHMAGEALNEKKAQILLIDTAAREKFDYMARQAGDIPVYYLASHVMNAVCDAKTPQGVAALCGYPADQAPENPGPLLVALDGVQDPGNVGTILRTMDAAGFTCLLTDEKTADPYSPKTLRASMGGVFRVPCWHCQNLQSALEKLAKQGYDIIAGDLHGQPLFERRSAASKVCIVIGNEGAGISPEILQTATLRLKIPMVGGAESLNAAVAGAILMYDILRERMQG